MTGQSYILNEQEPETDVFQFLGDCYICATGEGAITIERDLGNGFYPVTTERGEPMTYIGADGMIFNGVVTCNKKVRHRISGVTTDQIIINIVKERG